MGDKGVGPQQIPTPMTATGIGAITIVVMAKRPVPNHVKTRLIGTASPQQAALIHAAMLECVLARAQNQMGDPGQLRLVLALDRKSDPARPSEVSIRPLRVPDGWQVMDQGDGDLGERMLHVWRLIGGGQVVFLGVDSPDVPAEILRSVVPSLKGSEAAIGHVEDGGYWTLAARWHRPQLLTGIDWQSNTVYHQTCNAARQAQIEFVDLDPWYDVDTGVDLLALQHRLDKTADPTQDPALARLRVSLDQVCKEMWL